MGAAQKKCQGTGSAYCFLADKISACASENLFPCSEKDKQSGTNKPASANDNLLGDNIISAAAMRNFPEGWCIQNNQFSSTDYGSNVPSATRAYATRFMRCSLQYLLKMGCLLHLTG